MFPGNAYKRNSKYGYFYALNDEVNLKNKVEMNKKVLKTCNSAHFWQPYWFDNDPETCLISHIKVSSFYDISSHILI